MFAPACNMLAVLTSELQYWTNAQVCEQIPAVSVHPTSTFILRTTLNKISRTDYRCFTLK